MNIRSPFVSKRSHPRAASLRQAARRRHDILIRWLTRFYALFRRIPDRHDAEFTALWKCAPRYGFSSDDNTAANAGSSITDMVSLMRGTSPHFAQRARVRVVLDNGESGKPR